MTEDTDTRRIQVIRRLRRHGFTPRMNDQILRIVDAMMTGHTPLAHVLLAAAEVCDVCDLSGTHQHVADAVACLAGEVLRPVGDDGGAPRRTRPGVVYWSHMRRGWMEPDLPASAKE